MKVDIKDLLKKLNRTLAFSVMMLCLSLSVQLTVNAQTSRSFKVNGKKIKTEKFNTKINTMMSDMGVPGMSLAIIENDEVVFYKGYGLRKIGGEPVTQETIFNGCSLSKSILVFVVMQMVDEGKLDLDKPVYEYLPHEYLEYDDRHKLITARMILSHSSGIENWSYQNNPNSLDIVAEPGAAYVYSGEGYNYLARVAEKILGQSYEEYATERVLNGLQLKNTYLKFIEAKSDTEPEVPANHAIGHQISGHNTVNNTETHPAAGNHYTAHDYAKIVIGTFGKGYISKSRRPDLLEPLAVINNSTVSYGPGFEVAIVNNDTIVSHGGDSDGYKNMMFYSVTQKRGFVFMSNIDWGTAMSDYINQLTVELDIEPFLSSRYHLVDQYPSKTTSLLKISNQEGYDAAFTEIDRLKASNQISESELNLLATVYLWYGDFNQAAKLLEGTLKDYPQSATALSMMGQKNLNRLEFYEARDNFRKAKALGFDIWDIAERLEESEKGAAELDRRKSLRVDLSKGDSAIIEAEDYNDWGGIVKVVTVIDDDKETDGIGDFDDGNWIGFTTNVSEGGVYTITVRAISPGRDSELELHSGDTVLAKITVPESNSWSSWTMPAATVKLAKGIQSLRLVMLNGYAIVNWLKVAPTE